MLIRIFLLALILSGCQTITPEPEPIPTPEEPKQVIPEPEAVECPAIPEPEVCTECPVCPVCPAVKPAESSIFKPIQVKRGIHIIGAVEKVFIDPPGISLEARIDTGADSSSLHAINIIRFERDEDRWVRFTIPLDNGEEIEMELPIERRVRIIQANDDDQRRYVVKIWMTLGDIREQVDVTLTDRSDLEFALLVGRNFLVDTAIVDVSKKYTKGK